MTDDERARIREEATADAALKHWMVLMEGRVTQAERELAEYRGWKKNGFLAAIGLAGLVLAQPFLRFWEGVIGK